MKTKGVILIPSWITIGDASCFVSMVFFLTHYYEKVYFVVGYLNDYFDKYFYKHKLYKKNIFLVSEITNDQINTLFSNYHIVDLSKWSNEIHKLYYNDCTIDKKFYFNQHNRFYNVHQIARENIYIGEVKPLYLHIDNYNYIGLTNNVRLEYYEYTREIEQENKFYIHLLAKYKIKNQKYNVINISEANEPFNPDFWKKYTKNDYPIINISMLAPFPGYLLKLIERANSVHLVDTNNVQFIYLNQYKKNIEIKCNVYFHVWKLNRIWPGYQPVYENVTQPKLKNWIFYLDESNAR